MPRDKVKEKRLYDIEYRRKNRKLIRAKKRLHEQSPAGRAMQKRNREKFKQCHLDYCRTPEYRKEKKAFDEVNRCKRIYGHWWEVMLLVIRIKKEVWHQVPDKYERYKMRGVIARIMTRNSFKRCLRTGGTPRVFEVAV